MITKNNRKASDKKKWGSKLWPLALVIALVPLIVHSKVLKIADENYRKWLQSQHTVDFFSYYKLSAFIMLAIVAVLLVVWSYVLPKIKNKRERFRTCSKLAECSTEKKIYFAGGIYLIFATLSTIFSKHREIAIWGLYDRHEGIVAIWAYVLVFFIGCYLVRESKDGKVLSLSLFIPTIVMGVIGITQFAGHDIFASDFGRRIILDSNLYQLGMKTSVTLEKTIVYGTLYHANYMGSFAVISFFVGSSLLLLNESKKNKALMGAMTIMSIFLLFGSRSRAGLLGLTLTGILALILYRKILFKTMHSVLLGTALFLVIAIVMNVGTQGALFNKLKSITFDPRQNNGIEEVLRDIQIDENNSLLILTSKNKIAIRPENNAHFKIMDQQGRILSTVTDAKTKIMKIENPQYSAFAFQLGKLNGHYTVKINISSVEMFFRLESAQFTMLDPYGNPTRIEKIESFGFKNKERWGSARAYIWSRSLPLLKNTILLGYGPDTFVFAFPQNDYVGKMVAYGTSGMIVDKPHNIFLQMALNTGVISALSFLFLIIMYIKTSVRLYLKGIYQTDESKYGVAFFLATIAYLIAGLFNDSVLSVAPVFWIIFGAGFGLNLKQLQKIEIEMK